MNTCASCFTMEHFCFFVIVGEQTGLLFPVMTKVTSEVEHFWVFAWTVRIPYILTTSGLTTSRQCWGRRFWVNQVYKLTTLLYADKVFDNSFKFWSILMANERFLSSPSIFYYYQCRQKYIYTSKWFSGPNIAYHRQMKDFPAHQVSSFIINAVKEMSPQTLFRQMFFFKFRKYQGNPYSYCDDNGVFRK